MKFPEVPAFLRFARFHDIRTLRGPFHFDQNEYVQVRRHEEGAAWQT